MTSIGSSTRKQQHGTDGNSRRAAARNRGRRNSKRAVSRVRDGDYESQSFQDSDRSHYGG